MAGGGGGGGGFHRQRGRGGGGGAGGESCRRQPGANRVLPMRGLASAGARGLVVMVTSWCRKRGEEDGSFKWCDERDRDGNRGSEGTFCGGEMLCFATS